MYCPISLIFKMLVYYWNQLVMKAEDDWQDGQPQVAMHH